MGLYDIDYLKALFHEDQELIQEIEENYAPDGLSPLGPCSTMLNFNSMKVNCHKYASAIYAFLILTLLQHMNIEMKMGSLVLD